MPHDMQTEEPDPIASGFHRLETENAALRAALARAETSASVQAMRAGARGWDAVLAVRQVEVMRRSLIWRLTLPLRLTVDLLRGAPSTGLREASSPSWCAKAQAMPGGRRKGFCTAASGAWRLPGKRAQKRWRCGHLRPVRRRGRPQRRCRRFARPPKFSRRAC